VIGLGKLSVAELVNLTRLHFALCGGCELLSDPVVQAGNSPDGSLLVFALAGKIEAKYC
jgi:hypothetical protein